MIVRYFVQRRHSNQGTWRYVLWIRISTCRYADLSLLSNHIPGYKVNSDAVLTPTYHKIGSLPTSGDIGGVVVCWNQFHTIPTVGLSHCWWQYMLCETVQLECTYIKCSSGAFIISSECDKAKTAQWS